MEETIVSLLNVGVSLGNQDVLKNISLAMNRGELVSLVGPSGCGKTTLLRLCAGLIQPGAGSITVLGGGPTEAVREGKVAFGFQEAALLPWLDGEQNARWLTKMRGQDILGAEFDLLWSMMYLTDDERRKRPHQLSGGERQRTSLVRSLCTEAELYLLDEPLSAVDYTRRVDITSGLRDRFKSQNAACLLVTHDIPDALHFADRVIAFDVHRKCLVDAQSLETNFARSGDVRSKPEFTDALRGLVELLSIREDSLC